MYLRADRCRYGHAWALCMRYGMRRPFGTRPVIRPSSIYELTPHEMQILVNLKRVCQRHGSRSFCCRKSPAVHPVNCGQARVRIPLAETEYPPASDRGTTYVIQEFFHFISLVGTLAFSCR